MAGGFTYEQQQMQNGSTAIGEAAGSIAGILGTLTGEVENMLGGWQSGASRAFGDVHNLWNEQQTNLKVALETMRTTLDQTSTTYATNDQAQQDAISQLKNNII